MDNMKPKPYVWPVCIGQSQSPIMKCYCCKKYEKWSGNSYLILSYIVEAHV